MTGISKEGGGDPLTASHPLYRLMKLIILEIKFLDIKNACWNTKYQLGLTGFNWLKTERTLKWHDKSEHVQYVRVSSTHT